MDRGATEILKRARALLRGGHALSAAGRRPASVKAPILVRDPEGAQHSWFVPVLVGKLMAGFFEFQLDGGFIRYSSFQRRDDTLEGCPEAETWINPEVIRRRAEQLARPGERAEAATLTYDKSPSRLAWRVVLRSADSSRRLLYVAGPVVWEAAPHATDDLGGQ